MLLDCFNSRFICFLLLLFSFRMRMVVLQPMNSQDLMLGWRLVLLHADLISVLLFFK
jgi:hypothetical protein